jgi:hypothetical protein
MSPRPISWPVGVALLVMVMLAFSLVSYRTQVNAHRICTSSNVFVGRHNALVDQLIASVESSTLTAAEKQDRITRYDSVKATALPC